MRAQNAFYRERIYPLLFMFLTTFFCILLTAGIHLATQDRANANELSFARKAVLDAAGITYVNTTAGIEEAYLKSVEEADGYFTTSGSDGKRFIIPLEGPGLWGTISIMIGFEEDLQTFTGVAIVSQNETPGLGARIEEPWFTDQFRGKRSPFTLVEEGTATASNEVDAITGATRTSEYFRNLANQAADAAKRIVRGE